jgi:hypothetical protein
MDFPRLRAHGLLSQGRRFGGTLGWVSGVERGSTQLGECMQRIERLTVSSLLRAHVLDRSIAWEWLIAGRSAS